MRGRINGFHSRSMPVFDHKQDHNTEDQHEKERADIENKEVGRIDILCHRGTLRREPEPGLVIR